jgi:plasmid stability protein
MRTTLTLDDDLARKLKLAAARQQKSFKEVVNQTLKKGLSGSSGKPAKGRVKLKTRALSYQKGVDEVRLKDLLDDLDVKEQAKS